MPHKWDMIRKIIPSIYSLSNGVTKEMIVPNRDFLPFCCYIINKAYAKFRKQMTKWYS